MKSSTTIDGIYHNELRSFANLYINFTFKGSYHSVDVSPEADLGLLQHPRWSTLC